MMNNTILSTPRFGMLVIASSSVKKHYNPTEEEMNDLTDAAAKLHAPIITLDRLGYDIVVLGSTGEANKTGRPGMTFQLVRQDGPKEEREIPQEEGGVIHVTTKPHTGKFIYTLGLMLSAGMTLIAQDTAKRGAVRDLNNVIRGRNFIEVV